MGMRWIQGDIRKYVANLEQARIALQSQPEQELILVGEELRREGQEIIESSGRNQKWSRPWANRSDGQMREGSGPGRIESGQMRDDFDYQVLKGPKVTRLYVGWIKKFQDYYFYQNRGFNHWLAGWVEGMLVTKKLKSRQEELVRKAGDNVLSTVRDRLRGR